jgi:hypothetical protein
MLIQAFQDTFAAGRRRQGSGFLGSIFGKKVKIAFFLR